MRAPVHRSHGAISQPVLIEFQEEPLRPFIIAGVTGDRLTLPIPHCAHALQLPTHALDIGHCPLVRMDAVLDGCFLCWQTEGVKSDGEHDVVSLHTDIARFGIGWGHGIPVPNVQVTRSIGKHGQKVELWPRIILPGMVQSVCLPLFLPLGFNNRRIVFFLFHHNLHLPLLRILQEKSASHRGEALFAVPP